ncbi:hybrid sensor histidine kinase/response regulator [Paenibacillus sp. GYB003]|uniref:hybrid sensor histidine kinase/response regulator n=1 Tax=Paenibacillus sp. GYB003 TaxID=2994392 RepID=UPI002F963BD4
MRIRIYSITKHIAALVLFLAFLLGMRWAWSELFASTEHPGAVQGVLDLRGLDMGSSLPVNLDGEWEFYPGAFVTHDDLKRQPADGMRYVRVPGDWRDAFPGEPNTSFGYGTYRLTIRVAPGPDQPYTFWIKDIQASSAVEINGQLAAEFGTVAERAESYRPKNVSYTAAYTAGDATQIELLIRVANFDQPNVGGIAESIRFGSQTAIDSQRWYSIGFQLVTFVILLLHGIYAGILYLFDMRQKSFIVFMLLLFTASLTIVSDDDLILLQWLPLNFTWMMKIRLLSYEWLAFFILLLAGKFSGFGLNAKLFRIYVSFLALYSAFVLAAPATLVYYSTEAKIFSLTFVFPLIWFSVLIGRMVVRNRNDAGFLMITAASIVSSVVWGSLKSRGIVEVNVYYPLDIIAAIVGFSSYWFKRYFRNTAENAKLNEQLRMTDKLKDQFLANTSHELRTPLHGIMNIAQTVADKEKRTIGRDSADNLELLITISRRMSHMVDELLDIARLQDKRIVLRREPLRLDAVVAGVFSMLRYMVEGRPVKLELRIAPSMPPVLADEKRLVQILFNLVHNAIKFTDKGNVTVSAVVRGGRAVIEVSDTGAGMDEATLSRIFLPYEQGAGESGGIGLGLSICKQLVELHDGSLEAYSEPGKGTVFHFGLPLAQTAPDAVEAEVPVLAISPASPGETDAGAGAASEAVTAGSAEASANEAAAGNAAPANVMAGERTSILAVDDDPVNLKVLTGMLAGDDCRVRTASSGREALELLDEEPWDLLIVDVMMPHMSGYELTRIVRERFSVSELPVLLLTARSEPADIYAGFHAGANDYVAKPVDALELKARIRLLTTLKRSVEQRLRLEAAYLQAQIHPHFLFNTLNSIMALSDIDTERMRKLGHAFASFLRISFDFLNAGELVPLSHEMELVRAYLYIERERFGSRLTVEWNVEPGVDPFLPPLTIQPLVENAVKHGLLVRKKGGTVRIRIERRDNATLVAVEDDGDGMTRERIETLLEERPSAGGRSGIGLSNTNRRLKRLYGQGLTIRSVPGEGTTVSFVIPRK